MGDFKVGFGRVNITPDFPVPLASYGTSKNRIHDRVLNELYFTAVAVTGTNGKTLLLTTYDITQVRADMRDDLAERVQKELGIDPDYFHLSGTHTHSSVDIWFDSDEIRAYVEDMKRKAVKACRLALEDQKKAEIYVGETKTDRLNFVRHYIRADGTVTGDNYGYQSKAPSVKHLTAADNTLRIVKFVRQNPDGTPARDVVAVNWQAHDHLTGGGKKRDLAADWSGAMRSWLESQHDCFATFFQGCAGNVNPHSRIANENRTLNYLEHGRLLAGYVNEIYDNEKLKKLNAGEVATYREVFRAKKNTAESEKLANAKKLWAFRKVHGVDDACKALALELGFHSPYHATAIVARSEMKEDYFDIPLWVFRIGDLGWTAAPFEMFDQTGAQIRAASPFPFTVTQGYTDANFYYMPTETAFGYGCYEADTARYACGTTEGIRDKMVEMLQKIKEEEK